MRESTHRVERAVADLADGKVIVLAGCGSENPDAYLVVAGEKATTSALDFIIRHTSGFVCATVTDDVCVRTALSAMSGTGLTASRYDYAVTVDAATGVSTGISAKDRARTLRQLADPTSTPATFTRPGHVMPLRAHTDGTLDCRSRAQAVTDLLRAAGLQEVGALAALVSLSDPTAIADSAESLMFAAAHQLHSVSVADVVTYRRSMVSTKP